MLWAHNFSLARESPRSWDSLNATSIISNYQESRKPSEGSSERCSYSIAIIKRNIICNKLVSNQTIKIARTIKRRSNIFLSLSKTSKFYYLRNSSSLHIKNTSKVLPKSWSAFHVGTKIRSRKRNPKIRISPNSAQHYTAQITEAQILDDKNKSNHVKVYGVTNSDLSQDWRHATQSIANLSMAGTPDNKLNKIWGEMKCDNKEVVHGGVESAAPLLRVKNQVGKLSGSVD